MGLISKLSITVTVTGTPGIEGHLCPVFKGLYIKAVVSPPQVTRPLPCHVTRPL